MSDLEATVAEELVPTRIRMRRDMRRLRFVDRAGTVWRIENIQGLTAGAELTVPAYLAEILQRGPDPWAEARTS